MQTKSKAKTTKYENRKSYFITAAAFDNYMKQTFPLSFISKSKEAGVNIEKLLVVFPVCRF
jgi:hypothetical protein